MAWFSKICCSDPRYCKSETIPYCTCKHTGNNVFTEIENIPVIGYYKFTIDSGKALTFWFSKSLQYSSGLYTKYISFLYKIPNIHRLCCRNNKTQDEQDHLDNCYLEHYLMVFHGRYNCFFFCCCFVVVSFCCFFFFMRVCSKRDLFVCKARFVLPNRRKLVRTKEQKKQIN